MTTTRHTQAWPRKSVTGPGASAIKYDILTALLTAASQADPVTARLALRLSVLITARFNWQSMRFSVGQVEIGRLWGVTQRTAKREVAHMRARGWISVVRSSARGRVAEHQISFPDVLRDTMPYWSAVGPDFVARMSGAPEDTETPTNVVPLRREAAPIPKDGSLWSEVAAFLEAQDPEVFSAWFASLQALDEEPGALTLMASGRFQADYIRANYLTRLTIAVAQTDASIRNIRIKGPSEL